VGYEASADHLFEKYPLGISSDAFDVLFAEEPIQACEPSLLEALSQVVHNLYSVQGF
jgi:hypothetical protein